MPLYSLAVFYKVAHEGKQLKAASDLTSFSYFQRGSIGEFMTFTGKIIVERSPLASRSSVKEQGYLVHTYVRQDGLAGVVISDEEYPSRVAQSLLSRTLDSFTEAVPPGQWATVKEAEITWKDCSVNLAKFQNPEQADAMTRVQSEIDETKVVLHNTITAVLERGEKLDDLVTKSDELSNQSKMFYTQAKKMNKCCTWV